MRRSPLLLVLLLAAGCGGDGGSVSPEAAAGPSPFTVDRAAVPAGYELAVAGRGDQRQVWGSDSAGTDEPFTVLAPPGEDATSDRAVVVSVTGFEGYEGGFDQAAFGSQGFLLDGRRAIYGRHSRAGGRTRADLVVQQGEDLAVRVTALDASQDELVAIARRVRPAADRGEAPAVEAADGLEVVGSVDADAVVAMAGGFMPHADDVPGPEGSYGAGWLAPNRRSLVVQALPGDAADLAALGGLEAFAYDQTFDVRTADVDGLEAVVVERTSIGGGPTSMRRVVVVDADGGQLVVVVAGGATVPEEADLLGLAATVRPTDAATWEELVTEARGGPGLTPDRGARELARGTEGGVEWLLQAWPDAASAPPRLGEVLQPAEAAPGPVADSCLKLSTGERACTAGLVEEPGFLYGYAQPEPGADLPLFAIFQTELAAAAVRITTTNGTVTADLHEMAGSGRRAAVAFVDLRAPAGCDRIPRIEVVAADGAVVGCPGF